MDVSIIIVNYNTKQLTSNCIDSIIEKTFGISYEIIVVDNASTDGSKVFFEKDERIKYIYNKINGGFGYGNNIGSKYANGKYLLLLNSDTLLINNAINEFYVFAEKEKKKRVYGCYLVGEDNKYACSFFYFPAFTISSFLKRFFKINKEESIDFKNKKVECISGANMFILSSVFKDEGGFDESIFLYGEEGELQYRLLKRGFECYIINTPQIKHLEGKSSTPSIWKQSVKWRSHFIILKKHMSYSTYLLARCYYALLLGFNNYKYITIKEGRTFLKLLVSKV